MTFSSSPAWGANRRKRLSAARVNSAPPGKHCDEHGLILVVKPTGGRSWVQRLTIHGKRHDIGLGGYPWVSLAEARDMAYENRRISRRGGDPRIAKSKAAIPTFAQAAETVIALYQPTWKAGAKTAALWRSTLNTYAYPVIGEKSVADVDMADVLAILSPIWTAKAETARKVRNRIGAVIKWCIVEGHCDTDPTGDAIGKALPTTPRTRAHHRALPHSEVADAIAAVNATGAAHTSKLAFEFLVLTACRSGEVRLATWDEIDLDAATWTIPAARMKAGREHKVPLSGRALAILTEAGEITDGSGLVFPSARGKAMSDGRLSKLIRDLGIDAVVHGFRSSFRDWCGEATNAPREVCEAALAHAVRSQVEAAYARSDLFDKRRRLMDQWAAYLTADAGGRVVPMVRRG